MTYFSTFTRLFVRHLAQAFSDLLYSFHIVFYELLLKFALPLPLLCKICKFLSDSYVQGIQNTLSDRDVSYGEKRLPRTPITRSF